MTKREDVLFEIFDQCVDSGEFDELSKEELFDAIVDKYTRRLRTDGQTPALYLETIKEDIWMEVAVIYKVKTYGFLNLKAYRLHRKSKP